MDSDQEDDYDDIENNLGASGFSKTRDEDEKWGSESDNDEGDNEYHYNDSDSDEDDGFQGGRIRGELYENKRVPSKEKKKKDSKKSKTKKKKNIMYEADDYMGSGTNAIDIGIGNVSALSKRKKEMSLSMAERLQLQSEESKFIGDAKRLKVRGQGSVKEVTFIPKATRKKLEAQEKARQEAKVKDDRIGRSRRGVKSLGFKTPFKHQ
jgi:hypothetical protein